MRAPRRKSIELPIWGFLEEKILRIRGRGLQCSNGRTSRRLKYFVSRPKKGNEKSVDVVRSVGCDLAGNQSRIVRGQRRDVVRFSAVTEATVAAFAALV